MAHDKDDNGAPAGSLGVHGLLGVGAKRQVGRQVPVNAMMIMIMIILIIMKEQILSLRVKWQMGRQVPERQQPSYHYLKKERKGSSNKILNFE